MKKLLAAVATACCVVTAPAAFAGFDVFVDIGAPRVVTVAAPVAYYRYAEPRWHERHEFFERRHEYRERHEHFRHHDWR